MHKSPPVGLRRSKIAVWENLGSLKWELVFDCVDANVCKPLTPLPPGLHSGAPPLRANVIYERPLTLCEQTHLYTAEYVSSNEILWVGEVRFSGLTNSRSIVERRVVQWPMYSSSIMVLLLAVQFHLFSLELSLYFRPFRHQEFSISPISFSAMFWCTLPFSDRRWR